MMTTTSGIATSRITTSGIATLSDEEVSPTRRDVDDSSVRDDVRRDRAADRTVVDDERSSDPRR